MENVLAGECPRCSCRQEGMANFESELSIGRDCRKGRLGRSLPAAVDNGRDSRAGPICDDCYQYTQHQHLKSADPPPAGRDE